MFNAKGRNCPRVTNNQKKNQKKKNHCDLVRLISSVWPAIERATTWTGGTQRRMWHKRAGGLSSFSIKDPGVKRQKLEAFQALRIEETLSTSCETQKAICLGHSLETAGRSAYLGRELLFAHRGVSLV